MNRKVIAIGEAVHADWERLFKRGTPMSEQRTPAQEEAKRIRITHAVVEQGNFGQKTPAATTFDDVESDDDAGPMPDLAPADVEVVHFLCPSIDEQLDKPGSSLTGRSIMEEITEMYLNKTLRPFVEGEPIGCIPSTKKKREKQPTEARARMITGQRRQDAMLRLRVKNDRMLKGLEGR
jgi:hypothetical protein